MPKYTCVNCGKSNILERNVLHYKPKSGGVWICNHSMYNQDGSLKEGWHFDANRMPRRDSE